MEKVTRKYLNQFWFILFVIGALWVFLFYFKSSMNDVQLVRRGYSSKQPVNQVPVIEKSLRSNYSNDQPANQIPVAEERAIPSYDPCSGRYVYVHDLPSRFNDEMLEACKDLNIWINMCKFLSNSGLGPRISGRVFSNKGWFATNQFALDVIFHNRMKKYKCLTNNSSYASAIFVPFYAGLDIARHLWGFNISVRDSTSLDLVNWLVKRPEWKVMGGRDHFLVAGRITWDFRRTKNEETDWGSKLLFLPEVKNMTTLVLESSPWSASDIAIPYPTYFHPSKDQQVYLWQKRMRGMKRRWLFSFAGAPRPGNTFSIRDQIIDQCQASKRGKLLRCDLRDNRCQSPSNIMKLFQSSVFCLQPQGDSYTRRSAFDSMVAGCIPVFFHPASAYVQYIWHLPMNYTGYSVLISENDVREGKVSIEKKLLEIPAMKVKKMREMVIELIPRLIYADPRSMLETVEDAFDVSVKGVIEKVNGFRREMGGIPDAVTEVESWKLGLTEEDIHEWEHLFSKPRGQET